MIDSLVIELNCIALPVINRTLRFGLIIGWHGNGHIKHCPLWLEPIGATSAHTATENGSRWSLTAREATGRVLCGAIEALRRASSEVTLGHKAQLGHARGCMVPIAAASGYTVAATALAVATGRLAN